MGYKRNMRCCVSPRRLCFFGLLVVTVAIQIFNPFYSEKFGLHKFLSFFYQPVFWFLEALLYVPYYLILIKVDKFN